MPRLPWEADSSCYGSLVPQGCPAFAPARERSSSEASAVRLRHGAVTSRWQLEIAEVPLQSGREGNLGFLWSYKYSLQTLGDLGTGMASPLSRDVTFLVFTPSRR